MMGILGLFETRSGKVDPQHPRDPGLARMFGLGDLSSSGMYVNPDSAMREAAVHACIKVLSEDIAKLPLIVYQRASDGSKRRATDHPLYDVLHNRPNANQTSFEWRETCQSFVLLRGNGVSRIRSTGGKGVAELEPLFPERLRIFKTPRGRRGYEYSPEDGQSVVLMADEVLHIPGLSFDGIAGLNPLEYHRETIGHTLGLREFGSRFFKNSANSNIAITHEGTLSDTAFEHLRQSIKERQTGVANTGKPLLLEEGMQIKQLSISPEDSQLLESRKYGRSEIAGIFRVPLYKIAGDAEASKGWSTLEQQSTDYVTDSLMPWLVRWEQAISTQLLTARARNNGYFVQFLVNGLLRGDAKTRAEYYNSRFRMGTLSRNDIRRLEDENPIDGGDQYFVTADLLLADQVGKQEEDDE